ncbi:MAG: hypothetical protein WCH21_00635 [Bacteroidota bacterium]
MKKLVLSSLTCLSLVSFSQENSLWRLGVQWGFQGNKAEYAGAMANANARFHQNNFDAAAFNVEARYDLNKHWMGTFSLGVNTFGFQYALAENYSLRSPQSHFSGIKSDFSSLDLPLLIFYKFNPNCKNSKWLIGGGFSQNFVGAQSVSRSFQVANDGSTNSNYLNSVSSSSGGGYTMLRFAIAREKVYKRGNILNASFIFNAGFKQMAKSTVNYTVDGQTYTHEFTNFGNFAGFRLTYFFMPIGGSSASKAIKTVKS